MFIGFDYGTSNCAMSYWADGRAHLIPLAQGECFLPSTLYAFERPFLVEYVLNQLPAGVEKNQFAHSRAALLSQSRAGKIEHDVDSVADGLFFGDDAIEHYIASPSEGYFIKSPKSFLGASGLRQQSVDFFEDVVAAMMINMKQRAEQHLQKNIEQVVIGRPVNFQGLNAEKSNQQAQAILLAAGKRAGFKSIEFLFEPLAAGFDFETRMTENKRVLVVDVGGGTTDCSMVLMGPKHISQQDRSRDFLGHTGERIGGNDFDIQFAQTLLMPPFGLHSMLKSGLPMPIMPFVNAMAVNDMGAQSDFYDLKTDALLARLLVDTTEPELLQRFIHLRKGKHNFAVVRAAEQGKIALSKQSACAVDLQFVVPDLAIECTAHQLAELSAQLLAKMSDLVKDAIQQAGVNPDIVYLTGGSAKSPLIQRTLRDLLGDEIALVDGDHFGSVVAGLGVWSHRIFA